MSQEIKIVIKLNHKPVSVNALYKARVIYQGGKPRAAMYKAPESKAVEDDLLNQLRAVDWNPYMDFLKNTKHFSLLLQFVFQGKPSKRIDADNHIKHVQDCLAKFLKGDLGLDFDDSLISDVHCYKSFVEKGIQGSQNMVFIQLKESHFNLRFDVLEKPEKVFIAQPDDALKKFLKKNKVKVKDKQEQSNTSIHLIPGPITPAKALEINTIVDEAEKFCYIGLMGPEPDSETLQALEMTTGGKSSIKIEWIGQSFDKILEWINSF